MSLQVPNKPVAICAALVAAHNAAQEAAVTSQFHADAMTKTVGVDPRGKSVTATVVASATASDLPTALLRVNELKLLINAHFADTMAHDSAVSAAVAVVDAEDQDTAETLANALKTAWNAHLSEASVHFNNDATNTVAAADASNLASLQTLVNELATDFAAHVASAPAGFMIKTV